MASILKLIVFSVLGICITVAEAAGESLPIVAGGGAGEGLGPYVQKADAASPPIFKFGGFGTLGVSHSSQALGDYVLDGTIPKGAGLSNSLSWGNDSRIGAQLTANFTHRISAVLQVVSEYGADSTYRPKVEWANVKYAFTPDAYVRVGRIALPTFMNADSRKVGYSYPWVHPPTDLYRQLSITNSDGMDASYRLVIGEAENIIKIIYGRNINERPTSTSTARNMRGIFDTIEYGPASIRIGYQARESSFLNHLTGVASAWHTSSDLSIGATYNPGDWFVMSEWMQRKSTTKASAMYVSAGCRINKFTPYLTYSQNSPSSSQPGFPAPTVSAITNAARSQNTISLGARWDFMKNADFKLQLDQVRLSDNSNGYLANIPAGVTLYGTRFNVITAVLDFLF